MLAIGAGGLDVAVSMGGGAYYLTCPRVVNVRLLGRLTGNTSAKDIILEVLRLLTVKGGVGKVIEYSGDGASALTVPERATITNMGAELGATSSVFPSDGMTEAFLKAQGRGYDYTPLCADDGATYDSVIDIDLSSLEPLAACPHSPDAVRKVKELVGIKVDQVCIGSCTNSSLMDMQKVADILRNKSISPRVSLTVSPGSRQVLTEMSRSGALADIIDAGARILECACGPCIGMGQSPATDAVSVRTFNRNFYARTGTKSAGVYLVSCETAAATALTGYLTDPNSLPKAMAQLPQSFTINDNLILDPNNFTDIEVVRGPNIKPFPVAPKLSDTLIGAALVKLSDNITTDHIAPSDSKLLPYRSNIPYLSSYCLSPVDPGFASRAVSYGGGMIIAGSNYGQGSSREHAVLVPVYLKISAVIAKSFARIHRDNLINNGILPLEFMQESDYDLIEQEDKLSISDIFKSLPAGQLTVMNETKGRQFTVLCPLSDRQRKMITAGGLLNTLKEK